MNFCSKKLFAPSAAIFIILIISISFASPTSIWTTDAFGNAKTDFAPGETVYISGDGFSALSQVSISVTRPDLVVDVCPYEWRCGDLPMTDELGSFLYYPYVLNGIEGTYVIDASDGANTAQVSFTDADKFEQWADKPPADWQNGALNSQNSAYHEGEAVPFHIVIDGPGTSDISIRISYDAKGDGKNGYDFLVTYNADRVPTIPAGTPVTYTIPYDSSIPFAHTAGVFTLYNANFVSVSSVQSTSTGSSDDTYEKYYEISVHPTGGDIVLLWGGHLASELDWGTGFGASSFPGGSLHMYASGEVSGTRGIDASAVLPPVPVCGNGIVETGEDCDPGTDVPGDCCDASCHFEPSSYTCRGSTGVCDLAETCSGTGADCPADSKSIAECRPAAGDCDVAEYCDGTNDDCPTDVFMSSSVVCRPAADQCDIEEYCTGYGINCPVDGFQPYSTVCEADSLFCTVDYCDGYGSCVYQNNYDCSDSNECTDDICNDDTDQCENPAKADGTDCTGDPGKCCSGVCDADGTSGSGYATECRTGPSCVASGDWGYSIANDGSDCGTCCTCSSGSRGYDGTQDNDCSPTLCADGCEIDANPFTWDYANDEPNYCQALDTCTDNACQYQHQCRDNDPNDGFNGNTCGAECDQDSDCDQTTGMCDYANREYCTRDTHGMCTAGCSCSYDEWSCSTEGYCENCNHCGDGVVNCGEDCENSETGEKCLPEGTSVVTVINGVCYMYPEYDTCDAETCTWSGCEKVIVDENDPRYVNCTIEISEPTCGTGYVSCVSGCCTTTTYQMPIYTYTPPTFNYPSYTFTPTTTWPTVSYTTTTSRTTTTMQKYTYPSFTFPTFTFPKFTVPTFNWG